MWSTLLNLVENRQIKGKTQLCINAVSRNYYDDYSVDTIG